MTPDLLPDRIQNPKKWNLYFLEFLLIFLAVTLGFFAESIRDNMGELDKEKEFIQSMIEDAVTDTLHIQEALALNTKRMNALDTLTGLLLDSLTTPGVEIEMYRLYRQALSHPIFVSPTERTMTQLKYAGGMRLIRKKPAIDVIVQYDDMAKNLVDQQAFYELYQNASIEQSIQIFNFRYFRFGVKSTAVRPGSLLSYDKLKLLEFGNRVSIYSGVVRFYTYRLEQMKNDARNLIVTLKKEYAL